MDKEYKNGKLFLTSANGTREYTADDLLKLKVTVVENIKQDQNLVAELDNEIIKIRSTV